MSLSNVVKAVEVARVNNAELGEAIDAKTAAFATAISDAEQSLKIQMDAIRTDIKNAEEAQLRTLADLRSALERMRAGMGDHVEAFDKDLLAIIGGEA